MESGDLGQKDHPHQQADHWSGPGRRTRSRGGCARATRSAGFTVLDVPGHSPGHVAYWRESDRTLIAGDVLNNMNILTGIPGCTSPAWSSRPTRRRNRESARRLGTLEPALVVFGHGPPLRDTRKFVEFMKSLPR